MLEIRPNCELCDKDLPANSPQAYICTYECTFCRDCVDAKLFNVCPNCGGGFCERPIRPIVARRDGVSLEFQPPAMKRINTKYSEQEIREFSAKHRSINPNER